MITTSPALLSLALLHTISAAPLGAQDPTPGVTKTGVHFALHCHGGDEALAQSALDAVEAVWPFAAAMLGGVETVPKQPLPVHLYRAVADYEAVDMQLSRGKFQRNLAMTWWQPRESHVALQPPCRDEVLRAIGLPSQTAALLAWEASHLARSELCPNFADHPAWFVDGFAAHVAGQVLLKLHPCSGAEAAPFLANRQVTVQRLLPDGKLPKVADLLADRVDDLDIQPRYAARAVFFDFLAADKARLAKVTDIVRRTGGGTGYRAKVLAAVRALLGSGVDKDFQKYVRALKPQWEEVYRSLTSSGSQWPQLAFGDTNAIAWNTTPVRGGVAASGTLRILPGEMQQMNFLLGRTDAGFYSVAFTVDAGFVVFDFQSQRDPSWQEIGRANAPGLRLGYSSKFDIVAVGKSLVVKLDQLQWEYELPRPLPAEVVWGIGAQRGSAGLWGDLEVGKAK